MVFGVSAMPKAKIRLVGRFVIGSAEFGIRRHHGDGASVNFNVEAHSSINAAHTAKRGAGRSRRPFVIFCKETGVLHLLLFAHFGRSIPAALGRHAVGLGLCFCHVTGERGPRDGKCYGHSECRDENFHGVFSVTLD